MGDYLRRYVGTYRVKCDYDLDTNDFIKDAEGDNDKDFDGQYIDCFNNIKIRHVSGTSKLSCYIPNKTRGVNILKKIYLDKISETMIEETIQTKKYFDNLTNSLKPILENISVLDYEVYFEFKTNIIDYIATLVGVRTNGASISPSSVRNLPKSTYTIPEEDIEEYKQATKSLKMHEINQINKEFLLKNKLIKERGIKPKEFIHEQNLWEKYCNFLKQYERKYKNEN